MAEDQLAQVVALAEDVHRRQVPREPVAERAREGPELPRDGVARQDEDDRERGAGEEGRELGLAARAPQVERERPEGERHERDQVDELAERPEHRERPGRQRPGPQEAPPPPAGAAREAQEGPHDEHVADVLGPEHEAEAVAPEEGDREPHVDERHERRGDRAPRDERRRGAEDDRGEHRPEHEHARRHPPAADDLHRERHDPGEDRPARPERVDVGQEVPLEQPPRLGQRRPLAEAHHGGPRRQEERVGVDDDRAREEDRGEVDQQRRVPRRRAPGRGRQRRARRDHQTLGTYPSIRTR